MLNVLIPLAGKSAFFPESDYHYPRPLIEVAGKPMIERVIENIRSMTADIRFHFVVGRDDCQRFHLDRVLLLVAGAQSGVVRIEGNTKGSVCSCLMAIESIPPDEPLVIANADQIISAPMDEIMGQFYERDAGGGVLVFPAVHPRWSFARIEDGLVVETSEKVPISNRAIAGFYFFSRAELFFEAAKKSIRRGPNSDGNYYIAPVYNELILAGVKVVAVELDGSQYHSFYTPQKLSDYETLLIGQQTHLRSEGPNGSS